MVTVKRLSVNVEVVGRLALPDGEDRRRCLGEDPVAVLAEDAEHLGVGGQRARADAEDEAALGQVVEHRRLREDFYVTRLAAGRIKRGLPQALRRCGYKTFTLYPAYGAFLSARRSRKAPVSIA